MGQKDSILNLLKENGSMTQSLLAQAIYNDTSHSQNIYKALMDLVRTGKLQRNGSKPAYYSLSQTDFKFFIDKSDSDTQLRDVSGDIISDVTIEAASNAVVNDPVYGKELNLITRCLKRFPDNTDPDVVAMKIGLIDITNSTHLSQYKSKISIVSLAKKIAKIENIDERIKNGDPTVVNEIANNKNINLFSFATKYCCYHNRNLYENDDYSIYDTVLKEYLPLYFKEIKKGTIQKWKDNCDYESYNIFITKKLDELGIQVEFRKRKFDHFVWYKNRKSNND